MTALNKLDDATRHYRDTKEKHDAATKAVTAAAVAALKAGERPTDVVEHSPFTAAYIRKIARDAGIERPTSGPGSKRDD